MTKTKALSILIKDITARLHAEYYTEEQMTSAIAMAQALSRLSATKYTIQNVQRVDGMTYYVVPEIST